MCEQNLGSKSMGSDFMENALEKLDRKQNLWVSLVMDNDKVKLNVNGEQTLWW